MTSLKHGVNLSRRACRRAVALLAVLLLPGACCNPIESTTKQSPSITVDGMSTYPGLGFGPMGPVAPMPGESGPQKQQAETTTEASPTQKPKKTLVIAAFEFHRVETPFLIGLWIFFASIAKIEYLPNGNDAIWAHLRPILESLLQSVENLHFLSDGPVTQYRNKTMFYVLASRLKEMYPRIMSFSWNYHEAGHGKVAPDGIGTTCKRTADQVIAAGGDITNLKEFCKVVRERCPAINTVVIEDREIDDMNRLLNENTSDQVPFRGTLLIHQVTGSAFVPNRLTSKSLSCFCNSDGCNHYKLGSIKYKSRSSLNISNVFTDSEDETSRLDYRSIFPVSQDVRKVPENLEMGSVSVPENTDSYVPAGPGISYMLKSQLENGYGVGDYLLIRYKVRKTEYRYVGVCNSIDEDDGDLRVTFLKLCNKGGTLFKVDETDVSDVQPTQIIKKLSVPNLTVKGNRVFYSFKEQIDVFEK